MKKIITLSCISFLSLFANAQETQLSESKSEKTIYIKANAALLPVLVVNAGAEFQLAKKYTLQTDFLISPWKSFAGHEASIGMLTVEGRYYFKEAFKGWYLGANITGGAFKIQKWSYWSDEIQINGNGEVTPYIKSTLYEEGYALMIGATAGYQFPIAKNWNMDIFLGFGNIQSYYKGYDRITGNRYDEAAPGYNKSGEWLPYRGGIMISYKIK